ncbi:MAG: M16 family metallopeptidase, partial [Bacillota bacterium]
MKLLKAIRIINCMLLLLLLSSSLTNAQKGPKEKFIFPKLNKIEMPKIEQITLKNGMRLFLIEDHQYPTIDLRAMIGAGSIYEPADKIGLASVTGTVMRTGGTEKMPGDQIDKLLESLGADVEIYAGGDASYAYVSLLKEDIDKGINIFSDLLMHPAFPEDKIDLSKIEQKSWISRRNDNIWSITDREFRNLIYGRSHPYARYAEYSTINSISREDIAEFYKKYFHPNNILLAAWGDFNVNDLKNKLEAAFSAWPEEKIDFPEKPQVNYQHKYTVNFVQKSDVNQSHIQLGHIGGKLNDPDYPALVIMNEILSADRMFKVLRTKEGLTYAP